MTKSKVKYTWINQKKKKKKYPPNMHQIVKNTHLKYTPKAILNQTQTKYKKWSEMIKYRLTII